MEANVSEPDFSYSGQYSYADYLRWTIEERLELIKGKIFQLAAPNRLHQDLCGRVYYEIATFLKRNKPCSVYIAPFDVRLPRKSNDDKDIITVLQPDVCVICDPAMLDDRGCIGAPDIVVEILSPGNNKKELRNKYAVYEESGVREYWIVSPLEQTFMAYHLDDAGQFIPTRLMTSGDIYTTGILPGFQLDLEKVFED